MFNEKTLQAEIEKTWGEAGAHADVYRTLLNEMAESYNLLHHVFETYSLDEEDEEKVKNHLSKYKSQSDERKD